MNTRERIETALSGGTPDRTPLAVYTYFTGDWTADDRWRRLIDMGLGLHHETGTVRVIEHGVEDAHETALRDGRNVHVHTRRTPAGEIRQVFVNNWQTEHFVKSPADYKVLQWIVEHSECVADYDGFARAEDKVGQAGFVNVDYGRTPAMTINVDLAGTERFCMDVAMETPELMDLYHAMCERFLEMTRIVAAGPGRFVRWLENLTIGMLGPRRYEDLLLSVYRRAAPILHAAGKRIMVHYDGQLSVVRDQIASAPFDILESLTEPPEGDMTYDQCRAAWPDKAFWANINVGCFGLPPEQLKAEVAARRSRAGKKALAFEISEDLPANFQQTVPVVLETLEQLC